MSLTLEQIQHALSQVVDPNTGKDLITGKTVRELRVDGPRITLKIELGYPAKSRIENLRAAIISALQALDSDAFDIDLDITSKITAHAVQRGVKLLPTVKNIIAVASGKGGVGKSTTAVNLALALAAEGASVGILDADIYGPSQPTLLGLHERPESRDSKTMDPLERYGIQMISMGLLIEPDTAMVWRGPMVTQALQQLLEQTNWRDLDYLIVDMPPGTGDIQLTLAQKVPVTGAVIVTTPQDIALMDARRGLKMFEKVGIPILGIVENMSLHVCSQCGHAEAIFGAGGAQKMCAEYGADYLGGLPLDIKIRIDADAGQPTVVADPDGVIASTYKDIARKIAVKIATSAKDMSLKFPTIVVQNT